jgi:hypothetical protein
MNFHLTDSRIQHNNRRFNAFLIIWKIDSPTVDSINSFPIPTPDLQTQTIVDSQSTKLNMKNPTKLYHEVRK